MNNFQLAPFQPGVRPFSSVLNYFSTQVKRAPHATALVGLSAAFTYEQLDHQANQLANFLQKKGVSHGDLVGVQLERSPDAIIAFLAILKAGAAYVPIDPSYPQARRSYILSDSQAKVLLTEHASIGSVSNESADHGAADNTADETHHAVNTSVVLISEQRQAIAQCSPTAPNVSIGPDDIAYIIYTSGTTGNPKGVMVRHEGVVNHAVAMARTFEMTPADRTLQFSSISFDVVVEELYPTLISGAALVLRPEFIATSLSDFIQFTTEQAITVLNLPAAFWHELVAGLAQSTVNNATASPATTLTLSQSIRLVVAGSEKVSRAMYAQWYGMVGEYPRWLNAYGPTETTVSATIYDPVREGFDLSRELPIGRAIENVTTHIFDEHLAPVKPGDAGELFIGGPGLAQGYLNKPEKTAAAFIPHPHAANQRLYRTGDIVRQRPDGNLEFLGRADFQVKIRGFRIELGEIGNCLEKHPQVQQQIVVAWEDESQAEKQLVAYVVPQLSTPQTDPLPANSPNNRPENNKPENNKPENNKLNSETLKAFLSEQLPSYAVPSAFVFLDKLPITANGKVDRKALPAPSIEPLDYIAPTTEIEKTLTNMWSTVLSLKQVGVNDNFFELGGSSLKAIRLFSLVEQELGQKLPLTSLLQAPTPAKLARTLTAKDNHTALWDTLVPLQTNGTKPPLFFLHAVGPSILNYKNLLPYFDEDQVVYALQTKGLDEKQPLLERMEQMATEYIDEIKKVQPHGPYHLVGHSFGGLMAFEMAQQLHKRGEKVGLLGLFDSSTPALSYCQTPPGMYQIHVHVNNLLSAQGLGKKWAYITARAVPIFQKIISKLLIKLGVGEATVENPLPEIYRRIEEVDRAALRRYSPQVYPGKMTLFRAQEKDPKQFYDEYLGWQYLIEGELEIHDVPGHHMSLMFEPNVGDLATKLQTCLNQAYTENEG
ncbi:MAG: amino acid adenylation domain-containing protein [Phormidesmis sp.]